MRALVTGVAGFVGSTLAARLLADGHEVVGIDALTDYYDPAVKHQNLARLDGAAFRFVRGDLNTVDLGSLLAGVEVVFHEAGQPGVRASWGSNFATYTAANVDATQRLLEACRDVPTLRRFVYASSSSIYGNAESYPTAETALPRPISPYGVTKLAGEHLVTLYGTNHGLPTVSLRYFTVYGPRQRPDMAFTRFTRAVVAGTPISIFGDGRQVRDFTFVDDVVAANLLAAAADVPPGAVFNVSGGSDTSVAEVLDILGRLAGGLPQVDYGDPVPGDAGRTGGSSEAFRAATGWTPAVTLREGLARQLEWARSLG